ncbi:TetR/AcrR family transcriptional regulator [Amycolatopsis sp. CA-230715]|uniref:TetR/AcrR family transcriptional regulator n=1 Tax=Amycolatopsis sp. CA-230715 TaxID=2745196 RepID=UPI0020B1F289|nr:TetR/AcrR family transcriptional regulator [Amycolatopsis sp. CA-230715]
MTRAEQQEHTHERLLEAGRNVLARRGFLAATVEEIAAEAGYTRGALYKHFGGKEGLLLAILDAHAEAHMRMLSETLDEVTNQEELVAAFIPRGFTDDEEAARWSVTTAEFRASVISQPQIAAKTVEAQRNHEERIAAMLKKHCARLGIRPALPLPQVVVVLGALGGSLSLRRGVDPDTDVAAILTNVLAVIFPDKKK